MGLTSLQVQMDPSDWLQDDGALDSSSPSSADMLACSRAPLMERRLRPPHDLALKCPRCESTNTKFCYYNNYSLTQPRYFCKTCRRYWTKGGTLRNIPVGGGCRKNKRQSSTTSSKKPEQNTAISATQSHTTLTNPTDQLQLSFPEVQLSHHHLASLMSGGGIGTSFLDNKYHALLDRSNGYDGYLGSKFDALVNHSTNNRAHDLLGSPSIGVDFGVGGVGGIGDHHHNVHNGMVSAPNYNFMTHLSSSSSSPFGVSGEGNSSGVLESSYQRLMLPYDYHNANSNGQDDVKPNPKLLSLQWQDNINGGFGGLSSWVGGSMFNGYTPSSTTNTLI